MIVHRLCLPRMPARVLICSQSIAFIATSERITNVHPDANFIPHLGICPIEPPIHTLEYAKACTFVSGRYLLALIPL